jgi:hypothetical protein
MGKLYIFWIHIYLHCIFCFQFPVTSLPEPVIPIPFHYISLCIAGNGKKVYIPEVPLCGNDSDYGIVFVARDSTACILF